MRVKGIHHVSLIVSSTATSLAFYSGVLGLAVSERRPELGFPGAWLEFADQQIHLLELPNPDPVEGRPAQGGRDRHVALRVDDLDAFRTRLEASGVALQMSRSGRRALFCRDPDGHVLELIAERETPRQ